MLKTLAAQTSKLPPICCPLTASRLVRDPLQQRLRLPILAIRLGIRQIFELPTIHLPHLPRRGLLRILEELLVLLETPPAALGTIRPRPHAGESVRQREDEKDVVLEVIEHDGRGEGDGEIGEAPDDDADGGALGAGSGGVDLGRDEPDGGQPADTEGAGGDEEGDDARDGDGVDVEAEVAAVHGEAGEEGEQEETDGEDAGAGEEDGAPADGVDEQPGEGHEEEVGDVVCLSQVFGGTDVVAEEFEDLGAVDRDGWSGQC